MGTPLKSRNCLGFFLECGDECGDLLRQPGQKVRGNLAGLESHGLPVAVADPLRVELLGEPIEAWPSWRLMYWIGIPQVRSCEANVSRSALKLAQGRSAAFLILRHGPSRKV